MKDKKKKKDKLSLPWFVYEGGNFVKVAPEGFEDTVRRNHYLGGAICEMDDWDGCAHSAAQREIGKARAEFIVRAGNSHLALITALQQAGKLFEKGHALSRFDWGKSNLRAQDIRELNELPGIIREALKLALPGKANS